MGEPDRTPAGGTARQELRQRLLGSLSRRVEEPPTVAAQVATADAAEQLAPFPMLDLQKAYWLGRAIDGVACHGYLELDVDDLDVPRFEQAFNLLIARHPSLRSVFDDDGRQRVLPADGLHYRVAVTDLTAGDAGTALAAARAELSHQVLPADRWPLFDVRVSRSSSRRSRVHLSIDILIADAQSFQILADELLAYYADPGRELPPIGVTFRDYVVATEAAKGEALDQAWEYWHDLVEQLPPAPDLPVARPAGPPRFRRIEARLDAEEWGAVVAAGRSRGVGAATVAFAAFAEALGVWAASPRFTVNLTQFNREPVHPDIDRVVGSFTDNTLVDVDLAGGLPFADFAAGVQRRIWAGLEHRAVSGVHILRELQRRRGFAAMPIVFTYVQTDGDEGDFRARLGTFGDVAYGLSQTPGVWLDCQVSESTDGVNLWWDVDERMFDPAQLDEMFDCFHQLLTSLAGDVAWKTANPAVGPDRAVEVRRATERSAEVPDLSLWDLVVRSAAQRPSAVAVVAGERQVTYAELMAVGRAVSARLRAAGAAGGLVAVHVDRGWAQVAAVLGVLGAGCAYLPVDPVLPAERVKQLLELGAVRHVVADRDVPPGPWRVVPVTAEPPATGAGTPGPTGGPTARDLAYVIFTSGTTGTPKGVRLRHDAVVNTVLDVNERFGISERDRVLAVSSVGFDLSVWDMLGTLAAGGTIVTTAPGNAAKDPVRWLAQLADERITVWNSAPALLGMLVDEAERRGATWPDLRLVLLSGDWIPLDLPDRIRAVAPGATVYSLGGATEAAIWSVFYRVGAVQPGWTSIPYGFPLTNQSLVLRDWAGRERPIGAVGELYIGGHGVADGYWNAPDLTDRSFSGSDGAPVYRTGDFARRHPDGCLEFLGRIDGQVKIQGHRIELGEIDSVLVRQPGVRAAVTAAVGPRDGHRQLVSVVVPEDAGTTAAAVRDGLRAVLPGYMVPTRILLRAELPTTTNGKVDRDRVADLAAAALAAEPASGTAERPGREVPGRAGPIAQHLLRLVREHLGEASVELDDDLLRHGMDSIHIVRLSGTLERELAFRPALENVLRTPTAGALATMFEQDVVDRLLAGERFADPDPADRMLTDVEQRERYRAEIERRPSVAADAPRQPLRSPGAATAPAGATGQLLAHALPRLVDKEAGRSPARDYLTPGGIAAVRAYLWLREPTGRFSGGLYVLDPVAGELVTVAPDLAVSGSGFDPFVYRPVFDRSPFAVFFVADYTPYRTLYGADGARFAALEAGAMAQVVCAAMAPRYPVRQVPLVQGERLGVAGWGTDGNEILQVLLFDPADADHDGPAPGRDAVAAAAPPAVAPAPPGSREESRPLTAAELRLWMFTRRNGTSPAYNIGGAFRLRGRLDPDRFTEALRAVVRRHPALRCAADGTVPVLRTWPDVAVDCPVVPVPQGASPAVLTQLIEAQAERPFDICVPPLFRAVLLRLSPDEHIAVLVVHHLIADDESVRILGQEVLSHYDGLAVTGWVPEPPPRVDVAQVLAGRAAAAEADPDRADLPVRRRESLLGTTAGRLPAGTGPDDSPWHGVSRSVLLSLDDKRQWEQARRGLGVTTQVLSLALVTLAVAAAGGPDECLVGMPDFGREAAEEWQVIGYFATTLLLRAAVRDAGTVADLVAALRDEARDAQAAKHLQPEDLVADRAAAAAGGFQLWLATYAEPALPTLAELEVEPVPSASRIARHDLRVGFFQRSDGLGLLVTHRPSAVDSAFVDRFVSVLTALFRTVPAADQRVEAVRDGLARQHPAHPVPGGTAMTEDSDTRLLAEISGARRRRGTRRAAEPVRLVLPATGDRPAQGAGPLADNLPIPVFEAGIPGLDLGAWIGAHAEQVTGLLYEHGAVLLRGMAGTRDGFSTAVELVGAGGLLDYSNRSTPRSRVDGNVFTSTEYPSDQVIPQHGEQAYTTRWPLVLGFRCEQPARSGGETPLASAAEVLRSLPAELVDRFRRLGVRYERWYHPHLDLPWSEVFQTTDPDQVQALAAADGIEVTWFDGGILRTRQRAQGVVEHPVTGVPVWFNQAHLFHPAALPVQLREELRRSFGDRLPRTATFGDGSPIADEEIALILAAFDRHRWCFRWQADDVLLVDNVAVTHGRNPFDGPRRVLVAMAGVGHSDAGGSDAEGSDAEGEVR